MAAATRTSHSPGKEWVARVATRHHQTAPQTPHTGRAGPGLTPPPHSRLGAAFSPPPLTKLAAYQSLARFARSPSWPPTHLYDADFYC